MIFEYYRIAKDYERRWNDELIRFSGTVEPDIADILLRRNKGKKYAAIAGVSMNLISDILGIDGGSGASDILFSYLNLGSVVIDNITEGKDKSIELNVIDALRNGTKLASIEERATATVFSHILENLGNYKGEFIPALERLVTAEINYDTQGYSERAEIGRAFGNVGRVIMTGATDYDLSHYNPVFESIFAGPTILDDLSDVFEDLGVKESKPLALLGNSKPTIANLLYLGIVREIYDDARDEFKIGEAVLQDEISIRKYRTFVKLLEVAYGINILRKRIQSISSQSSRA